MDLNELSRRTVNFSGEEIEALVRAAQNAALYRIFKARILIFFS